MGTLNITTAIQYSLGSQSVTVGSATTPTQITFASDLVCQRSIILNNAKGVLLAIGSAATDDIASVDAFVITSDKEVGISLEGSSAANNSTIILGAGQYIVFSDNQIYTYNASGDFTTTTQVDIATIRARNAASTDATVRIWAFT